MKEYSFAARFGAGFVASLSVVACATNPSTSVSDNGIYVRQPKVFDDRSLQQQLLSLGNRLSQLSGLDQGSLISRLGTVQGASSVQNAFSLQATTLPVAGVTTTAASGTPSTVQTTGTTTNSGTPSTVQTNGATTNTGTPSVVQTVGTSSGTAATVPTASTSTVTTTVSNGTGTTSQTVTTTPSTTTSNNNQMVTTTPSSTLQTVTAAPTVTPTPAPLPSTSPMAAPSAYNVSALDTLNEEMQLSYQMMNLQLLLQGSLDDDYTPDGNAKRHVTLGFPITVTTPKEHLDEVAEVSVSVCNAALPNGPPPMAPASALEKDGSAPSLRTIIPQEKTYNVASIVSKSTQLGVGAIVANVLNVGASFLYGHQTYYLVRQQDTVALERSEPVGVVEDEKGKAPKLVPLSCRDGLDPLTFAWQFRPVLGQRTVEQGQKQALAQVSLAPLDAAPDQTPSAAVAVSTCWRKYHAETGTTGETSSCVYQHFSVPILYKTLLIHNIRPTDNGDGSVTTLVDGTFPAGTRVGIGDTYLSEATAGFENTGAHLRFTAPTQLVGPKYLRLIAPDGAENNLVAAQSVQQPLTYNDSDKTVVINGDYLATTTVLYRDTLVDSAVRKAEGMRLSGTSLSVSSLKIERGDAEHSVCWLPGADAPSGPQFDATAVPFNDTLMQITVPLWKCMEVASALQYPPVVIVGGRAYGLSDAPFLDISRSQLTFLMPAAQVQGQEFILLKRLFLDNTYNVRYRLRNAASDKGITGLVSLGAAKTGALFALTGSRLDSVQFIYPDPATSGIVARLRGSTDTFRMFQLPTKQLSSTKTVVLQYPNTTPIVEVLPAAAHVSDESASDKLQATLLESGDGGARYLITGPKGSGLDVATFLNPSGLVASEKGDTYLIFSLSKEDAAAYKTVVLQPAAKEPRAGEAPKPGDKKVQPPAPVVISLPSLQKDSKAAAVTLTPDKKGITTGSTAAYKIMGVNLQQVVEIRYLNTPIPFVYASDGKSLTLAQLPASLVANAGEVPLEVRLADGSKQAYAVTVMQ